MFLAHLTLGHCRERWNPSLTSTLSFGPTAASVFLGVFKLFKFLTAGSTQERDVDARDDVEAPAGSSGIALANMATNQTPVAGAPPRGAEGQSEMPSLSKGLARANSNSSSRA